MIPKVIHYCWFGRKTLSVETIKCIESWKKYCPDYEIIEWNESNFDIECNIFVKEAYEAKKWAFVSDYARLKIIYDNGGIYLDTDVELVKNIDCFLEYEAFFGFENSEYINTGLGFGAVNNLDILLTMMDYYENRSFVNEDGSYNTITCPHINTEVLLKYGLMKSGDKQALNDGKVLILPPEYLCPQDYQTGVINITNNTYSIHHFSGSWHNDEEKKRNDLVKKCVRRFGPKLGCRIAIFIFLWKRKDGSLIKRIINFIKRKLTFM